ncbi:hypothetical protein RHODGE_RHODGE_00480 [Rhodoplanes serenus]|uniref:Uncharacterized protein n=1 Tax=Rhodoplanes serenus TaxID=200615 RepID=A0A447CQE6_9BRAD|nr:hypothetical protein RHODGE_RHODGE_00480 [Rhodoplanes serenus]
MRPEMGDAGIHLADTRPSAVQVGSRVAWRARRIHSRERPTSPPSFSSTSAISEAMRWVGMVSIGARLCRAVANSWASIAARATAMALSGWFGASLARLRMRARRSRFDSLGAMLA